MADHVLVIDDSEEITQIMEIALGDVNYQVSTCYSAFQALDFLKDQTPDVILLDIMLPDKNGLDLLRIIKEEYPHIPVIMITAFVDVKTAVEAMKTGAADFICKPFKIDDLIKVVKQSLRLPQNIELSDELPPTLEDVERDYIERTLKEFNGNRRQAAEALGISLRTLYYKIKQYDLGG